MTNTISFRQLGELFKYPTESMNSQLIQCQIMLNTTYPEEARLIAPFIETLLGMNQYDKEELFIKTFDVQAICYLDLGYIIFGEDYKRGSFLIQMKQEQLRAGVDHSPELPDHLCHVLTLLEVHPDKHFIDELVVNIVLPAIKQNIDEFESAKVDLKLKALRKMHRAILQEDTYFGNIYQLAFKALYQVLTKEFEHVLATAIPLSNTNPSDFISTCSTLHEFSCSSCSSN